MKSATRALAGGSRGAEVFGDDALGARLVSSPAPLRCNELQLSGARTANIGHFPTELFATIRSSKTGLSATVTTLFATEPQSLASNHII
jgi:hypothetical protein